LEDADMADKKLNNLLERFSSLPDEAASPTKLTSAVTGLSERTVRYHPLLPRIYVSAKRYGQRVGNIRALLAGRLSKDGRTA
jgi:hypothetical protein